MTIKDVPNRYRKMYKKCLDHKATRSEAIKCFCIECMGWSGLEARKCDNKSCPLWHLSPAKYALRGTTG